MDTHNIKVKKNKMGTRSYFNYFAQDNIAEDSAHTSNKLRHDRCLQERYCRTEYRFSLWVWYRTIIYYYSCAWFDFITKLRNEAWDLSTINVGANFFKIPRLKMMVKIKIDSLYYYRFKKKKFSDNILWYIIKNNIIK